MEAGGFTSEPPSQPLAFVPSLQRPGFRKMVFHVQFPPFLLGHVFHYPRKLCARLAKPRFQNVGKGITGGLDLSLTDFRTLKFDIRHQFIVGYIPVGIIRGEGHLLS